MACPRGRATRAFRGRAPIDQADRWQPSTRHGGGFGAGIAGAAQNRADTRKYLAKMERLGDVVVGTDLQADDSINNVTLSRHHDDRKRGALADLTCDAQAVHIGQRKVQGYEIDVVAGQRAHNISPARRLGHAEAFTFEASAQEETHLLIVVDDQDVRALGLVFVHPFQPTNIGLGATCALSRPHVLFDRHTPWLKPPTQWLCSHTH